MQGSSKVRYLAFAVPTIRTSRQISNIAEKANRDARQMLELAEADLELGFFHVKALQACRKSFAELVDANTELTIEGDRGFKSRYSATCNAVPTQVREESAELRRYYRQM